MALQQLLLSAVFLHFAIHCASALSISDLFHYGAQLDYKLDNGTEDFNSVEFQLETPIVFYGQDYTSIYVNENGLVSFLTEIPSFFSIPFPLDYPVISPLYSDVDTRSRGAIWYRESRNSSDIKRISFLIQEHFTSGRGFEATFLFIVTWDDVGYFDQGDDKGNTFQLVIASNGEDSFVLLSYPANGIQWIQGTGKNPNLPDARAQCGFVSGDGRYYIIKGSGSDQVFHLDKLSNIGVAGMWMYHVGKTSDSGEIQLPDLDIGDSTLHQPQRAETCAVGAALCHSKAICVDYNPGFCCQCIDGYVGNGHNCLTDGVPQRINGKVSGTVNGVSFRDEDLHSYVVTSDGRAYTAISKMPDTIGYDLQPLSIFGGVVGWLFAKPFANAPNGYQLTGGKFNFTTEVDFPQTGHHLTIEQQFLGVDVFSYQRMAIHVTGTTPSLPFGSKIEIPDYEEEYVKTGFGEFFSSGRRVFRIEGSELDQPFRVDHRIVYEECPFSQLASMTVLKLKISRNFVTYDSKEQIVRYAMTSKISPLEETEDPCVKGRSSCVPNSVCIVERDTFRCVCNKGFEFYEGEEDEEAACVDVNECNTAADRCDENAICYNEPGGYKCNCKAGYQGDGFNCQKETPCSRIRCFAQSRCVENEKGQAECRCLPGFQEMDNQCRPISSLPSNTTVADCRQDDRCDVNAQCVYSSVDDQYRCQCHRGYTGDGFNCTRMPPELETCDVAENCSPYATCNFDEELQTHRCQCLPEYQGDGYDCVKPTCILGVCWCPDGYQYLNEKCERTVVSGVSSPMSCHEVNICHSNAQCLPATSTGEYECQCNSGYVGDGFQCTQVSSLSNYSPSEPLLCDQDDICGAHATCVYDDVALRSACVCNAGYRGDGVLCSRLDECSSTSDCDANAQCVFDNYDMRYVCECNQGFFGDGERCLALDENEAEVGCNVLHNCDVNAECTQDESNHYICICASGFSGDGFSCEPAVIRCNVINKCHQDAQCVYDPVSIGYMCKCNEGFTGSGDSCRPLESCIDNDAICDPNAICEWNIEGHYSCRCNEGFKGDGYQCQVIPKRDTNILLISHGMSILRVPIAPSVPGRPIYIQVFQAAIGIDIDCHEGRVYWSDVNGGAIKSASYDGSQPKVFLNSDIGSPEGIAVDWASNNIYWTDSKKDTIEVANIESGMRRVLFDTDLVNPRGITVHPARGFLFWSDWDRNNPKIERSSTDGTNRMEFIKTSLQLPNSLTIDYDHDEICWADAGVKKIECVDVDGDHRRVIISGVKYPFGLTYYDQRLFWTDWEEEMIQSAQKESGELGVSLRVPFGGQGKLYGIVAVPETCPRIISSCQAGHGGCATNQLCLPNGPSSRTCL